MRQGSDLCVRVKAVVAVEDMILAAAGTGIASRVLVLARGPMRWQAAADSMHGLIEVELVRPKSIYAVPMY